MVAATLNYAQLALSWSWENRQDKNFRFIFLICLISSLCLSIVISSMELPPKERISVVAVPERVANFILEQEKPPPPPPPPVEEPEPPPELEAVESKETETLRPDKPKIEEPLTKEQEDAREKAAKTGLLALAQEMEDLFDTDSMNAMAGSELTDAGSGSAAASGGGDDLFGVGVAAEGSGGISSTQYGSGVGGATLSQRELTQVRQTLLQSGNTVQKEDKSRNTGLSRAEETIITQLDRNKGRLYTAYNKARRDNPGLRGKLVLEITISPDGRVTDIKVISTELDDAELIDNVITRIKGISFGEVGGEPVKVTYPIEFLPS